MGRDHETLFAAPAGNPVGTLQKKLMSMVRVLVHSVWTRCF